MSNGLVARFLVSELRAKGKKLRIRRPPRYVLPDDVERSYRAYLVRVVNATHAAINQHIKSRIRGLVADVGRADAMRADVVDVEAFIKTASKTVYATLNAGPLRDLEAKVDQYKLATSTHQRRQLRRQIRMMISLDAMPPTGSKERSVMDLFLKQNVELIKSLSGDYVDEVTAIVERGVSAGDRAVTIEKQVEDRWGVAKSRAALIARDQISKLNGNLTRIRQESLGIDRYIWRTSRDERVRNTHLVKEGVVYRWDDPPPDTGHPGQDFQCRCTAEPYLPLDQPLEADRKEVIENVLEKREELREELKGKPSARLIPKKRPKIGPTPLVPPSSEDIAKEAAKAAKKAKPKKAKAAKKAPVKKAPAKKKAPTKKVKVGPAPPIKPAAPVPTPGPGGAPSPVQRAADKASWHKGLSEDEKTSFVKWSGSDYGDMRTYDRDRDVEAVPSYIPRYVDGANRAMERAPRYEGTVSRGLTNLTDADVRAMTTPGAVIENKAMSSWTFKEDVAADFASSGPVQGSVILQAKTKKGVDISGLFGPAGFDEGEVMLSKGSRFRVTGQTKLWKGEIPIVELEEL